MQTTVSLRRAIILLAALSASGCSYATNRANDFADMFRLEVQAGYGLNVDVVAGELVHVGLGGGHQWSAGLTYGRLGTGETRVHHLPISYIATLVAGEREKEHLHSESVGENESGGIHRCYLVFPRELNPGTIEKPLVHYLDVEVGVMAGFIGIRVGFSFGEFVDFILGLFKFDDTWTFLDPAGDDTASGRKAKRLWQPKTDPEGRPSPH